MPNSDDVIISGESRHTHIFLKLLAITTLLLVAFTLGGLTVFKYKNIYPEKSAPPEATVMPAHTTDDKASYEKGYQDAMDNVNEVLTNVGVIKKEVMSINGAIVRSVTDNKIIVAIDEMFMDLFKSGMIEKTIIVPSGFLILVEDADKKLTIDELKSGDILNIESKIDIRNADTLEASSITLVSHNLR